MEVPVLGAMVFHPFAQPKMILAVFAVDRNLVRVPAIIQQTLTE
jgi:hypothetical protein